MPTRGDDGGSNNIFLRRKFEEECVMGVVSFILLRIGKHDAFKLLFSI